MMPDLGKYAGEVTLAYAVALALLLGISAIYLVRALRVRAELRKAEDDHVS